MNAEQMTIVEISKEKLHKKDVIKNHKKLSKKNPTVNNHIRDGLFHNLKNQSRNAKFNVVIRKSPK